MDQGDVVNKGLTTLASGVSVDKILDEDTQSSDDASALVTQQSIKAYVDTEVAGAGGGALSLISTTNMSAVANSGDITIQANRLYKVHVTLVRGGGSTGDISMRVNSSSGSTLYSWFTQYVDFAVSPVEVTFADNVDAQMIIMKDFTQSGTASFVFHIDTYTRGSFELWMYGKGIFERVTTGHGDVQYSGFWSGGAPTDFEILTSTSTLTGDIRVWEYAQS